jgi:DNA-binding FadR family transcriptional regulator
MGTSSRVHLPAASAVVVEHLRRDILLGTYAEGEKLPPEREHAALLGVSRTTLREAVRSLAQEGLVEVRRGSSGGTVVRGVRTAGERRRQLRRRLDEVLAIQEFRLAIEPLAAERAAAHRTAAAIRELERSIGALEAATGIGAFRRADSTFHLVVARSAACAPLLAAVEQARIAMFEPLDALGFDIVAPKAIRAHTAILRAIERQAGAAARRAMVAHIHETTDEIRALA